LPDDSVIGDRLAALGDLFNERGKVYGSSWRESGALYATLLPGGVELRSAQDFCRFAIFMMVVGKIQRYAKNFSKGGHKDSLDDIAVYAQMLRQLDEEFTTQKDGTDGQP
jgi:hypothetical protein